MKKIYTLIAVAALGTGAFAQDDFAVTLVTPASGSTSSDDPVTIDFNIENVGTTTAAAGDTVWCGIMMDGSIFGLDITPGGVSGFILEEDLAPGGTFPVTGVGIDWLPQTEPTSVEVCAVVYGIGTASFSGEGPSFEEIVVGDDDVSNNSDCFTAELPVEVDDASIEDLELVLSNVYVAGGNLMIVNEGVNAENQADLNIINMNGQIVQNENFVLSQGTTTVGIDSIPAGIYIVSIEVDGVVITKKISIQ